MEEELDLKEIFDVFWSKKFWIIGAVILGIILGAIYTGLVVVPKYSSYVTVVLTKSSNDNNLIEEAITQSDITLNQKLISTYSKIIKSKAIINKVITDLNLSMSYNEMLDGIKVEPIANTDVMQVTVTTKDPNMSVQIVNYITKVFEEEITKIYNIKNTFIMDKGEADFRPVNISWPKNLVIFAMVAAVITMMIIFLIYFFDTSVKTKADLEKLLNIPVLGVIPKIDEGEVRKNERKK